MMRIGDQWAEYRREGKVFIVGHNIVEVAPSGISDILIRVPENSSIIALLQGEIADYANFLLYENPSITSVGTALTPRNMNRSYSDDTDVLFFHSPTVGDNLGQQIYNEFSLAWLGYFNEGTGVWELKKGTDYVLRVQNLDEEAGYLNLRIVFRKITE